MIQRNHIILMVSILSLWTHRVTAQTLEMLKNEVEAQIKETKMTSRLHIKSRFIMLDMDQHFVDINSGVNIFTEYNKLQIARQKLKTDLTSFAKEYEKPVSSYEDFKARMVRLHSLVLGLKEGNDSVVRRTGELLVKLDILNNDFGIYQDEIQSKLEDVHDGTVAELGKQLLGQLEKWRNVIKTLKVQLTESDFNLSKFIDQLEASYRSKLSSEFDDQLLKELIAFTSKIDMIYTASDLIVEVIDAQSEVTFSASAALSRYANMEDGQASVRRSQVKAFMFRKRLAALVGLSEKMQAPILSELKTLDRINARFQKQILDFGWKGFVEFQFAYMDDVKSYANLSPACLSQTETYKAAAEKVQTYAEYSSLLPKYANLIDQCLMPQKEKEA